MTSVSHANLTRTAGPAAPRELPRLHVLIVDDHELVRRHCQQVVESHGHIASAADSPGAALDLLDLQPVDILLADLKLPGMSGIELLELVKKRNPRIEVVIMTGYSSVPSAVQAMKLGAADYLVKPFSSEEIGILLRNLGEKQRLRDENHALRSQLHGQHTFGRLVGHSQLMQNVFKLIQRAAPSAAPVLIQGESGTGKELVARSIHEASDHRHSSPFTPVDCGALVPTLIESELFGYVKGAFTGAAGNKAGLMEIADDGTLFLDEIGELPLELQTRLLRVIQEREFRPIGSTRRHPFEARIIAASNRDLEKEVHNGRFRSDLYFRLNVINIQLPPLRERKGDIPLLCDQILARLSAQMDSTPQKAPLELSSAAMNCLLQYDWPGNVRELENYLERAVTLGSRPMIDVNDLPANVRVPGAAISGEHARAVVPLVELERDAILRAVAEAGGDRILAARMLGIGKTTLYRKLREYGHGG